MRRIALFALATAMTLVLSACDLRGPTDAPDGPPPVEPAREIELLSVFVAEEGRWEWGDENDPISEYDVIAHASWEKLRLANEDAASYPNLNNALIDLADSQDRFMSDQMEFMAEDARLYLEDAANADYFNGYSSTSDYNIMRADNVVMSIMEEFSSYTGGAHPYWGVIGVNLDPATGEIMPIESVIADTEALPDLIGEKLVASYGEHLYDTALDLLSARDDQGNLEYSWNWSVNYQGVTFYFNPYELAPYAAGMLTVTLWFDEAPELFNHEFLARPTSGYCIEVPMSVALPFDIDQDDEVRNSLELSVLLNEEYSDRELSISLDGKLPAESNCSGYSFDCFLACVGDPSQRRHFLYVEAKYDNDYPTLFVYDLNGANPVEVGSLPGVGFTGAWYEDGESELYYRGTMDDPGCFDLSTRMDLLGTLSGVKTYSVDASTGMPASEQEAYRIPELYLPLTSTVPLEVIILPDQKAEVVDAGTQFTLLRTDGETYAEALMSDGRECRIEVDCSDYPHKVNGLSEFDCFEMLYYAG